MRTILTRSRPLVATCLAAVPLLAAACGGGDGGAGSAGVTVIAPTTHLADLARNVAGDRAEVVGLLAPSADPHDHEPRPSDVEAIADADLVLESGGGVDLWLADLVEASGTGAPVESMLYSVETIAGDDEHDGHDGDAPGSERAEDEGESPEGEHADDEGVDPHWWHDPRNAVLAVRAIRDRMIEIDPAGVTDYEASSADYVHRLEELDAAIAECIGTIPERERKLVTSHDALGYFADRYGIEVVGATIPALTTQAQPSAGETAELVDLIRDEGVRAVFGEVGAGAQLEQAIADETGARVGGDLWTDTLGPEGSGAETYLEAMAANARTLAAGLGGDPESCATLPRSG